MEEESAKFWALIQHFGQLATPEIWQALKRIFPELGPFSSAQPVFYYNVWVEINPKFIFKIRRCSPNEFPTDISVFSPIRPHNECDKAQPQPRLSGVQVTWRNSKNLTAISKDFYREHPVSEEVSPVVNILHVWHSGPQSTSITNIPSPPDWAKLNLFNLEQPGPRSRLNSVPAWGDLRLLINLTERSSFRWEGLLL